MKPPASKEPTMNQSLTILTKQTTVDQTTGEIVSEEMVPMAVMVAAAKPGECALCNRPHAEGDPHDAQNLAYQYRFYAEHGRFPTWLDAMAHCSEEVRKTWTTGLAAHGVDVEKLRDPEDQS